MNPIQAYEAMVTGDDLVYCAYAYGYTNYARETDRPRLRFANAPSHGTRGCAGTQLGGTGVAVSALSRNRDMQLRMPAGSRVSSTNRVNTFASAGSPAA